MTNRENASYIKMDGIFSGGYVDNLQPHKLDNKNTPFGRNFRITGQGIKKRPGFTNIATFSGNDYPRGLGRYLRSDGADRLLVRYNESGTEKLITIDESFTQTPINTGALITSDERMDFVNVTDVMYCFNGVDNMGKLDGTTYTNPAVGIASFDPKFATMFNGALWAAGRPSAPNTLYKSVGWDPEDFAGPGSEIFSDYFNEQITGLSTNNKALFVFTENTINVAGIEDIIDVSGTLTYNFSPIQVKEGATNNNTVVAVGNNIYYLSKSNKISQMARGVNINGYEVLELSDREYEGINKLMWALDQDQTDAFAYYAPKENLIKWHVKSVGASFNDTCIIYDLEHDQFLVDTQKYFYDGLHFNGNNYTASMLEPKVFQDEVNQDDDDSPIPFEFRTKVFDGGEPTRKKELWEERLYLGINELAVVTQEIYMDNGLVDSSTIDRDCIPASQLEDGGIASTTIGETMIGGALPTLQDIIDWNLINLTHVRTKGNLQVKGNNVFVRFVDNEIGSEVELQNLDLLVELLPELSNNLSC